MPALPSSAIGKAALLRSANPGSRRFLASVGILVALVFEICGCNPLSRPDAIPAQFTSEKDPRSRPGIERPLSFYDPGDTSGSFLPSSLPNNDSLVRAAAMIGTVEPKPLPWAIPESVYFVYRSRVRGSLDGDLRPQQPPLATAFVLSVPDRSHSRDIRFLVTARHVVDPQWAHCSDQNPSSIDLRLNRRSGGVAYETLALRTGTARHFYTPLDSTSDLAVIPLDERLIPKIDDYKFIAIPYRLLLTEAEMRLIRSDQEVMTARPSELPSGEVSNYPVFDGGVLSKMPTEAVGVQCGLAQTTTSQARMLHVWFINAGVPQGVSGAPVYTSFARTPGAAKTPVLLGVQSAAWPDRGIAGITPSPVLGDLIRSALRDSNRKLDFYRGPLP